MIRFPSDHFGLAIPGQQWNPVRPPDGLGVISEFGATGADDRVEGVDVGDVLVDDRLVDESPQAFGELDPGV